MASRDALRALDAQILTGLGTAGLTDRAVIGGRTIPGYYRAEFMERGEAEEATAGWMHSFDCREDDLPELEPGLIVSVQGEGDFQILRAEPDRRGRVLLLLGRF